jgi:dihydroceramidase
MNVESIVGGKFVDAIQGFWGPKNSSVNFCERDYYHSHYIAEFHNSWTSIACLALPIIGLLYSNPTDEWCFSLCYWQLIVVYCGSVLLHTTLTSWGQAADELPMLWMCSVILNAFLQVKSERNGFGFIKYSFFVFIFVCLQTYIYVEIQSLYHVFVCGYLSMVITIMSWSGYLSLKGDEKLLRWLWIRSFSMYVVLGSSTWLIDMHYCDALTEIQDTFGGITCHVIWHFGAAAATYLMINLIIVLRLQHINLVPELSFQVVHSNYNSAKS